MSEVRCPKCGEMSVAEDWKYDEIVWAPGVEQEWFWRCPRCGYESTDSPEDLSKPAS